MMTARSPSTSHRRTRTSRPTSTASTSERLASANGIFTITYTGDEYAHVWIDHEGENVTFLAGDESVEGEANNVTLAPNETVAVGLDIDTHGTPVGTQVGTDEFSISAKIAEPDEVTAMGRSTRRSAAGGPTHREPPRRATTAANSVASGIGHGETVRLGADGMHLNGANVSMDRIDLEGVRNERVELNAAGSAAPSRTGAHWRRRRPPVDGVPGAGVRLRARRGRPHDDSIQREPRPSQRERYRPRGRDALPTNRRGRVGGEGVQVIDEEVVEIMGLPEDRVHFRATTTEFSTFAVAERVPGST